MDDSKGKGLQPFNVIVPASTSNLGSGFDTISAALGLYLKMSVTRRSGESIRWRGEIPEVNIAEVALQKTLHFLGQPAGGFEVSMENPIPLKRGLGSSGAAIVGGIKIGEAISGQTLTTPQILDLALPLEGHPDNLSASLLGGWVLSCSDGNRLRTERIDSTLRCRFIAAVPDLEVSTQRAREILPEKYPLDDVIFGLQHCGLLVHALHRGDGSLLREATRDRIHQPYRSRLVPGIELLLRHRDLPPAVASDLLSVTISGSGSTVLAIASGSFEAIAAWMRQTLANQGIESKTLLLDLDTRGVRIEDAG
jgi:homoserine kinase